MAHRFFEEWLKFRKKCKEPILSHLSDLNIIEKVLREKVEQQDNWAIQHLIFELLQNFYGRYQKEYNKVDLAKSFLIYNVDFYNDIIEEYFELGKWEESIDLIKEALKKVKFPEYYGKIIKENNRRPALKDEMKKKIGKT